MKADGSCSLGLPFSKTKPVLTGRLTKDERLTGFWEDENGKLPFEVKETYSGGSVQLNVAYMNGSEPLVKKPRSPKGSIEMALLTPVVSTNPVISDSVKQIILSKFMKRPVGSGNPEFNLNVKKQNFFEQYISSNEALYNSKNTGPNLNWESLQFMHILYNDNHFLTFYIISYAFTGGAHGLETSEFYVVDLQRGKIVTLSDIFTTGYEKQLPSMITAKFKEMNSLRADQKLSAAGFFIDDVLPNENFYMTGQGIGFFYNHYEIAPYAYSPNSCFIPFGEMKAFLNTEGVLQGLLKEGSAK